MRPPARPRPARARLLALGLGVALPTVLLAVGWLGASLREHAGLVREQEAERREVAARIAAAVREGLVTRGVMHACVTKGVPFVLCGSIRDDGPLPDVITDVVLAADAMRAHVEGVGVAIVVATTLHGVATGNILPARVATFCVDTDADTVIKLVDRGTHQAVGIVTDGEYFLGELRRALAREDGR